MRLRKTIVLAAMCAAAVASASAVEVSPDEAREAVAGWAAARATTGLICPPLDGTASKVTFRIFQIRNVLV